MHSICFIEFDSWQGRMVSDSAMVAHTHTIAEVGFDGEPMPQTLRDTPAVTTVLLICFLLLAYALKDNHKYIGHRLKNLFVQKRRASLFDDAADANHGFMALLAFVSCALSGVCLYKYCITIEPFLPDHASALLLLGIYTACVCVCVLLKWGTYGFVNWIFFDEEQKKSWNRTCFDLLGSVSLLLFPLLLVSVYLNVDFQISNYLMLLVLLIAELVLLYKCNRNFFSQFYGFLHFILYFCTLELVPLILFWKVIDYINNILILKF